jgi:hypothetical protein
MVDRVFGGGVRAAPRRALVDPGRPIAFGALAAAAAWLRREAPG